MGALVDCCSAELFLILYLLGCLQGAGKQNTTEEKTSRKSLLWRFNHWRVSGWNCCHFIPIKTKRKKCHRQDPFYPFLTQTSWLRHYEIRSCLHVVIHLWLCFHWWLNSSDTLAQGIVYNIVKSWLFVPEGYINQMRWAGWHWSCIENVQIQMHMHSSKHTSL